MSDAEKLIQEVQAMLDLMDRCCGDDLPDTSDLLRRLVETVQAQGTTITELEREAQTLREEVEHLTSVLEHNQ